MPNQRKKGLKFVGAWVDEALAEELRELAESRGISVTTIARELFARHAANANRLKETLDHPKLPPVPSAQTDTSYLRRKRKQPK